MTYLPVSFVGIHAVTTDIVSRYMCKQGVVVHVGRYVTGVGM